MYPKNLRLKILVYLCCLFGAQLLEKGFPGYNVKVHETFKHISILSHSEVRRILVKSLKIEKMVRPVAPNCKNTA